MRPLLRNVAALAVLTLAAGAVLAWFAELTQDEVARNRLEAQTRILRELVALGAGDGAPGRARQRRPYALTGGDLVFCDRDLVVLRVAGSGYGGAFRLGVALDLDGAIKGVRVLEHAETPGFGDILNTPSTWLDSFTTGDVHAVTGATITSEAVMATVERAARRVRLEEICPARNETAGDGPVPSRFRGSDNVRRGRGQAPPLRGMPGHSVGDGFVPSRVGPAAALQDGRPRTVSGAFGSSGRPRAVAGATGSPLRVARTGRRELPR